MPKRTRLPLSEDEEGPPPSTRRNPPRNLVSEDEEAPPSTQPRQLRQPSTRTKAKRPTQAQKTKAPPAKNIPANKKQPLTAEEQRQLANLLQRGKISLDKVKEKAAQDALESKI
jgi:hypothetical protein